MATGAESARTGELTERPVHGRRIGVFGGTFDPPHVGHVSVVKDVADALDLDEVVWIPARVSPHKLDTTRTDAQTRLEMARAAARTDSRFRADPLEVNRPGASFTVDTLRELRATGVDPEDRLILIMGADQYAAFPSWRAPDEIRGLAEIAVMDREGRAVAREPGVVRVPVGRVDVSSTMVRERVAAGESIRDLVPEGVAEIIRSEGLYREPPSEGDR